jgi:hypothetical protein
MKALRAGRTFLLLLLFSAPCAFCQNNAGPSPALTYLGIMSGEGLVTGTAASLDATVVSTFDATGVYRQGIALDVEPWSLIPGLRVSQKDYESSWGSALVATTQLSFAAVSALAGTHDTDLTAAARFALVSRGGNDKSGMFLDGLHHEMEAYFDGAHDSQGASTATAEGVMDVFWSWRDEYENRGGLSGGGITAVTATGVHIPGLSGGPAWWRGASAWMEMALPFSVVEIITQVRYDFSQGSNTLSASARLLFGLPLFNAYAGYWSSTAWDSAGGKTGAKRLTAGLQFQLVHRLWFSAGLDAALSSPEPPVTLQLACRWEIVPGLLLKDFPIKSE